MSTFKNEAIVDCPVEQVFKVFIKTAKRDFPKFNEANPLGSYVIKDVGSYSVKTTKMMVEITEFIDNEVYEITSTHGKTKYISKYQFTKVDDKTKLTLTETEKTEGGLNLFNSIVAAIFFKGRIKKRFKFLVEGLEGEINNMA